LLKNSKIDKKESIRKVEKIKIYVTNAFLGLKPCNLAIVLTQVAFFEGHTRMRCIQAINKPLGFSEALFLQKQRAP